MGMSILGREKNEFFRHKEKISNITFLSVDFLILLKEFFEKKMGVEELKTRIEKLISELGK